MFAFGAVSISMVAFAQEDYTAYKSDVTAQAIGSFVKKTTQDGVEQNATNSVGVLGSYRYWFNPHNGVEAEALTQTGEPRGTLDIS